MRQKLTALILGIVLVLALAACQAAPAASANQAQPRTISVNGTGKIYMAPDVAYVFIGVQSQDQNVGNALSKNNEKAQAIAAKLKELGVDAKDIQTSSFNIYPNQQFDNNGQPTVLLYTVDNSVNVTVRDLTILGKLLDDVVSSGANSINGINFDILDRSKAISEARKLAIQDARSQADEIAQAAGVQIDQVYNLSVFVTDGATPLYDAKGGASVAAGQVPVAAGQLAITVSVSAAYTIK
jgi:uncharacterized protein